MIFFLTLLLLIIPAFFHLRMGSRVAWSRNPLASAYFCFLIPMVILGCHKMHTPSEKYYQFFSKSDVFIRNDSLLCSLNNPVNCPLRIFISTSDSNLNKSLSFLNPIIIPSGKDTFFKISLHVSDTGKVEVHWRTGLGDPERKITCNKVSLPFCKGKSYKVVQGYNGKFSHHTEYSRYAIDFNLKTNDTICAADSGFVVGVIQDYTIGGNDKKLQEFANCITLYHPHSGLYTQYVHLKYNGSLVKIGDYVKQGQAIGLSGMTGWTKAEHLHFNVLFPIANMDFLKSIPVEFIEHYSGKDLKINDIVKK